MPRELVVNMATCNDNCEEDQKLSIPFAERDELKS